MWDNEIDVDRVRERVKARLRRRRIFWSPLPTVIVGLMIAGWISSMVMGPRMGMNFFGNSAPWVLFFIIIVGVSMFRRAMRPSRSMPTEDEIARAVERELRREQRRMSRRGRGDNWYGYDDADADLDYITYEKPKRTEAQPLEKRKNEPTVRLGDDGELIFGDEQQSQSGHHAS